MSFDVEMCPSPRLHAVRGSYLWHIYLSIYPVQDPRISDLAYMLRSQLVLGGYLYQRAVHGAVSLEALL